MRRAVLSLAISVFLAAGVAPGPARGQVYLQPRIHYDGSYLDRWWSWAHWWEFNRHRYLPEPAVAPAARNRPDSAARDAAVGGLRAAAGHAHPAVRAAAAVALGRVRAGGAVDRLDVMTEDDDPRVRRAAWLALGLVGTPEAVDRFRDRARAASLDEAAASGYLAGLAALEALPPEGKSMLIETLERTRNPALAQLAVYALRRHGPEVGRDVFRRLILRSPEPRVVAEALLGLGAQGADEDFGLLGDVLLGQGQWDDTRLFARFDPNHLAAWHVWRPIKAVQAAAALAMEFAAEEEEDRGDLDAARIALLEPFRRFEDTELGGEDGEPEKLLPTRVHHRGGVWLLPPPSLFASSALKVWYGAFWEDGASELRLGLIALGHVAFEDEAERLQDVVRGGAIWYRFSHHRHLDEIRRFAPRRGFATLGLGAYLHRVTTLGPRAEFDHDDELERDRTWRRQVRMLRRLVENEPGQPHPRGAIHGDVEPLKIRAAALVALGMSLDPEVTETLLELTPYVRHNRVLAGYHLSSLARVHGGSRPVARRVIELASTYLNEPLPGGGGEARGAGETESRVPSPLPPPREELPHRYTVPDLMGLREIALALGMLGRPEAAPAVRSIMKRHPALVADAAWALRRSGDFTSIEPLIRDAAGDDAVRAELAAIALGELLEPGTGRRVKRLLLDHPAFVLPLAGGFAIRSGRRPPDSIERDPVYAVRKIAAPFLHYEVLPLRWAPR